MSQTYALHFVIDFGHATEVTNRTNLCEPPKLTEFPFPNLLSNTTVTTTALFSCRISGLTEIELGYNM